MTSRLLRRHLNHHCTYFCTGTKIHGANKKNSTRLKKSHHPRFEPPTLSYYSRDRDLPATPLYFLYALTDIGMYLHVLIDAWDILTKKRKQHPSAGDNVSTAEAAPGRVGKDEQGEARRANSTPNGGLHLELIRLRLKTWSKPDFSIAETTWPTSIHTSKYVFILSLIHI